MTEMGRRIAIAIETSGRVGSAAICMNGVVIDERVFEQGMKHASGLFQSLDSMFQSAGVLPCEIEEIYVSIGPGSFTGLRVGVTAAKTISMASGARVVPVPSLLAIAHNVVNDAAIKLSEVAVILDAKRGQIFGERFSRVDQTWVSSTPACGRLTTASALLLEKTGAVHVLGEGVEEHRLAIDAHADTVMCDEAMSRGQASIVAMLGMRAAARGEFVAAESLVPAYIRIPEPEEKRLQAIKLSQTV